MREDKYKARGINRKKQLTRRIRILVLLLSTVGVIGITYLFICLSFIMNNYSKMINEDYKDIQYMNDLHQDLYRHQTVVLEHMTVSSKDRKEELEEKAAELESNMEETLRLFGEDAKGREYESYYDGINSGIVGYFKNVDLIFDFSEQNSIETANYYMETTLKDYIEKVDEDAAKLNQMIKLDLEVARVDLSNGIALIRYSAIVLLLILMAGAVIGMVVCFSISEEMVNVDSITGIANYDKFLEYGEKQFKKGDLSKYVLISTNIKSFKYINQQLGSEYGDVVLKEYARNIKEFLQKGEFVARQNSDNFIVLLGKNRVHDFLDMIALIIVRMSTRDGLKPILIESRCGLYEIEEGVSVQEAIDSVTVAIKETRNTGAADYIWFTTKMQDRELAAKKTLAMFQKALKDGDFKVYYQPKVDLTTHELCGCEALVRWERDGAIVPPMDFIPVLEEEGQIVDLDYYVFERVCKDISAWIEKGICPVRVSSNFSKLHLGNESFAEDVLEIVRKYNVDTQYLEVELTESSGYDDFEAMNRFVNRMRQEKIFTAIDDFGTGYSSLSMLKDLDIDVVKLDKSFLKGIAADDEKNEKMVENIIHMINDLNHSVICEGVETEKEAEFLRSVDCFTAQGYLYDRPLPHEEFEKRLMNPHYNLTAKENTK